MSAELPTEEDVLAALVLWFVACEPGFDPTGWPAEIIPRDVSAVALVRWTAAPDDLPAAIADSERRLEMERARDAVVNAAHEWRGLETMLARDGLETAVDTLLRAERALEGK